MADDAADSEIDYLAPDFDPNSVTIPRLRNILNEHSVSYNSSAKKPQLVEIFNEQILPRVGRLRASRARIKRSSRGISNVETSVNGSVSDEEPSVIPTVEETPRRSARRSASKTSTLPDDRRTTSASVRSSTGAHSRMSASTEISDADSQRTARRRTRPSGEVPLIKEEDEAAGDNEESFFSSDNPFQSGSSPINEPVRPSSNSKKSDRRTTLDPPAQIQERKKTSSSSSRRKTDSARLSESASAPLKAVKRRPKKEPTPEPEPLEDESESEEDEESEEVDDEEADAIDEETALIERPSTAVQRRSSGGGVVKRGFWAIFLAILGGVFTLWRQEKINVGYCGIGQASPEIAGVEIPEWADPYRPQCEPCPPHASCYQNLITACEPGFLLTPHPLSLGGLIPLPPTCEPDGEKARKVKAVADRTVEELRLRNAQFECGELKDEVGKRITTPEVAEREIKETVASLRRKGMSQEEFEDLWESAIGEIIDRDEVSSSVSALSGQRTLRSTSLARISIACAIRRSVRQSLARNLWKLIGVIFTLTTASYTYFGVLRRRDTEKQAKRLASYALDKLATQAALHSSSPQRFQEAGVSMAQLRDDVLRDEFSAARRVNLWKKVQTKVEDNANVRSNVREGRSGEVGRVWEWVGATKHIEPEEYRALALEAAANNSEYGNSASHGSPQQSKGTEMAERKKWEERRPLW